MGLQRSFEGRLSTELAREEYEAFNEANEMLLMVPKQIGKKSLNRDVGRLGFNQQKPRPGTRVEFWRDMHVHVRCQFHIDPTQRTHLPVQFHLSSYIATDI